MTATAFARRSVQSQCSIERMPMLSVCQSECTGAATVFGEPASLIGSGTVSMCTVGFSSIEKLGHAECARERCRIDCRDAVGSHRGAAITGTADAGASMPMVVA